MNPRAAFPCPRTDAVLAVHLDGDLLRNDGDALGYGFACGESLHEHVLVCGHCQVTLRRARRLDAALAQGAGATLANHPAATGADWGTLAQRWFAAVQAPQAPPAPLAADPAKARRWPWWLAAAATVTAVLTVPWLPSPKPLDAGPGTAPPAVAAASPPPVVPAPVEPPPALAQLPASRFAARHLRELAARNASAAQAPASPQTLAHIVADDGRAPPDRLAAAAGLLHALRASQAAASFAFPALLDSVASLDDRSGASAQLHGRLLDLLRRDAAMQTALAEALTALEARRTPTSRADLAVLTVAARLGADALDQRLRRVVRRHPDAIDAVAAALRCDVRPHGGARLLLDLWSEVARRGPLDDAAGAARWFAGQPAGMVPELAAELATTRAAERRLRCLLALGQATEATAVPTLLARLRSSRHDDAHAAAFALSNLPRSCLTPLVAEAGSEAQFLLRAALARADLPAAKPWIDALALSPVERQRLHHGPLAEFPEVAGWFRERAASGD
jgi:hypothetical protein